MAIFPGKLLTDTEANNLMKNKWMERCLPSHPPRINYSAIGDRVMLPSLVVYIAQHKSYYLMTAAEFMQDAVQKQVLKERADHFGELVAEEKGAC